MSGIKPIDDNRGYERQGSGGFAPIRYAEPGEKVLHCGIKPIEYNVVVKPEQVEERTKGGLLLPDDAREKDQYGEFKGVLVAVSPMAFSFDEWPADEPKPKPGDRVVFVRYAGTLVKGDDDEDYRIMKDKDVLGVLA